MAKPKQLEIFASPPPTADERLTADLATMRHERALRDATNPNHRAFTRSRRKRDVRAMTVSVKRLPKGALELGRALYPLEEHADVRRPRLREDCAGVPRPCPFVSCRHHLYLDASARTGAIKLNFPDLEPDELPADRSCALDVAENGGTTLEDVGAIMNLTRERIRQVEVKALSRAAATKEALILRDFAGDPGPIGKRRLPLLAPEDDDEGGERSQRDSAADAAPDLDPGELELEPLIGE